VKKDLIVNVTNKEVEIALLEDKKLVELHKEKHNNDYTVGDLYLGRVKKLVPGLNAAFVDVGYSKDAFLHYFDLGPQAANVLSYLGDVRSKKANASNLKNFKLLPDIDKGGNIKEVLKPGQEILVQIAKEPISTKGPRISTELSIAGRYLVLVPFTDKVSVSSKIKHRKEKDRLRRLVHSIKPNNFGIIVRTVAENKKVADLDRDLRELLQKWDECFHNLKGANPPVRVLGELDRTSALLRDVLNDSFNNIVVNEEKLYKEIQNYMKSISPDQAKICRQYKGKKSVFDHFGVERQIKGSFGKNVTMSSGAYLVVEHTEALHVIDVNSGNTAKKEDSQERNALRTNLEAAEEIARQLRLRDMGGIIVVDFIDMQDSNNRKTLFNKVNEVMKLDRAKHYVLPPSKFGLVQITRQRVRPEMDIKTAEEIPTKDGDTQEVQATILLIDDIENALRFAIEDQNEKVALIKAHPFIDAYFKQNKKKYQWKWFMNYKRWIKIQPRTAYPLMKFKLINASNEEVTTN
jgi:ribonuclease G